MQLLWYERSLGGPPIGTSMLEEEAERLRELASHAKVALEVGSAYGFSAVLMAQQGTQVVAVDPHGRFAEGYPYDAQNGGCLAHSLEKMPEHLLAYGVSHLVTMVLAPSQSALPLLHASGARFDLVFVDGDHRHDTALSDLRWGAKLLERGGVLAAHDYGEDSCPGVADAIDELCHEQRFSWRQLNGTLWTAAPV